MKVSNFISQHRKTLIYVSIGILFIVLVGFSSKGYQYIKSQEKALRTQISELEKVNDSLHNVVQDSENYIEEILNSKEKSFYNEYVREYNKRRKAEKALKDIRYLVFDKQYLDSLAKHIRYR